MTVQTPLERALYEATLKQQRDERWRLAAARQEGFQEGFQMGKVEGRIQILQQDLGLSEFAAAELAEMNLDQLTNLEGALQRQLRERNSAHQ